LSGNGNLVKYIVELGVDINKEINKGETALFYVCTSGNEKMIREIGVDINKETTDGKNALFYACWCGNKKKTIKCLVENGADLNKENKDGDASLIEELVNSSVENPTSYHNVSVLVLSVMKDDVKITSAEYELKNRVHNTSDDGNDELVIERICCMLYSLSRDLRSYNLSSVDYYVMGTRKGLFGPYCFN